MLVGDWAKVYSRTSPVRFCTMNHLKRQLPIQSNVIPKNMGHLSMSQLECACMPRSAERLHSLG